MGRAPCCDKANVKKGPWSPEEDAKLKSYIEKNGTGGNWIALPQKIGLKRCGKSCRLRWLNYLRPNIKHGGFSEEEDNIICSLYISIGSRWSVIATQLPGRTDNDIKNYWNTRLKKKLLGKQRKEQQARRANNYLIKQEMKREPAGFFVVPDHHHHHHNHQPAVISSRNPYWGAQIPGPLEHPNHQDPDTISLDPSSSIKKLLIKLGGRFGELDDGDGDIDVDDDHGQQEAAGGNINFQYPHLDILIPTPPQDGLYETSMNAASSMFASSTSSVTSQLPNTHYDVLQAGGYNNGLPVELNELAVYGNPHHQLEGSGAGGGTTPTAGSFYGVEEMGNGGGGGGGSTTGTSSVESSSWGDISSLVYPSIISNYGVCLQDSGFEELRYLQGSQ